MLLTSVLADLVHKRFYYDKTKLHNVIMAALFNPHFRNIDDKLDNALQ